MTGCTTGQADADTHRRRKSNGDENSGRSRPLVMQPVGDRWMSVSVRADALAAGEMRVIRGKFRMSVNNGFVIGDRPDTVSEDCSQRGDPGEHKRRHPETATLTKPPGQRIGQQPASVRQGKLGGEQSGPILAEGRSAQKPARGQLRHREYGRRRGRGAGHRQYGSLRPGRARVG